MNMLNGWFPSYFRLVGFNGVGLSGLAKKNILCNFLRPMLEYGLCLLKGTAVSLRPLETAFNRALRFMFSVPQATSNASTHALAGAIPMKARHAILLAKLYARVLIAPLDCMISQALIEHQKSRAPRSCFSVPENGNVIITMAQTAYARENQENSLKKVTAQICQSYAKEELKKYFNDPKISSVMNENDSVTNRLRRIDKCPAKRASYLLVRWMVKRPWGKPHPCLNCFGLNNLSIEHVQKCTGMDIDESFRRLDYGNALGLLRRMYRNCLGDATYNTIASSDEDELHRLRIDLKRLFSSDEEEGEGWRGVRRRLHEPP